MNRGIVEVGFQSINLLAVRYCGLWFALWDEIILWNTTLHQPEIMKENNNHKKYQKKKLKSSGPRLKSLRYITCSKQQMLNLLLYVILKGYWKGKTRKTIDTKHSETP